MRQYGLIGAHLGHSFSKKYFEQKFAQEQRYDCQYDLFELTDISQLRDFVSAHPSLLGFNVTIPYKKSVLPLLDELDPEAESVGAVNTVRVFRTPNTSYLKGFNTDVEGFRRSLAGKPLDSRALVLGTGGASAAVVFVLQQWNVLYKVVSRQSNLNVLTYDEVTPQLLADYPMVVNCTPVGMSPNVDEKPPLPYEALTDRHFLYDLIYNPEKTCFLKEGERRGCRIENGMKMLQLQADAAWEIWNTPKRKVYP